MKTVLLGVSLAVLAVASACTSAQLSVIRSDVSAVEADAVQACGYLQTALPLAQTVANLTGNASVTSALSTAQTYAGPLCTGAGQLSAAGTAAVANDTSTPTFIQQQATIAVTTALQVAAAATK